MTGTRVALPACEPKASNSFAIGLVSDNTPLPITFFALSRSCE